MPPAARPLKSAGADAPSPAARREKPGLRLGQTRAEAGFPNPYRYTARRFEPVGQIYHNRNRDYLPALGRFLQPDPAGFADGPNRYAYVGNSPVSYIDPMGLGRVSAQRFNLGIGSALGPTNLSSNGAPVQTLRLCQCEPSSGELLAAAITLPATGAAATAAIGSRIASGLGQGVRNFANRLLARGSGAGRGERIINEAFDVEVSPGASLGNISASAASRIQQGANRSGNPVSLVGSRANGTAGPTSDFDFIVEGISEITNRLKKQLRSLPSGPSLGPGAGKNQDLFPGAPNGAKGPFIRFLPKR